MTEFTLGDKLLLVLAQSRGTTVTLREIMLKKHEMFGDAVDHGTGAVVARLDYLHRQGEVEITKPEVGATRYRLS